MSRRQERRRLRLLSDPFRRVAAEGPSKEELAHETRNVEVGPPGALPTVWASGDQRMEGRPTSVIQAPTEGEVAQLGAGGSVRFICGFCKYFDLENGRKEMVEQRFAERLVNDEQWKLKYIGAPIEAMGLCGASGGEMATSYVAKGCDQYRYKG